jgi:hypothetical protein
MEGVAGSIPAPPTTKAQQNQPKHSASLVDVSASIGLNDRTVPKRAMQLGKRRAKRSHKVPPVERRSFAITDGTVTAGYVEQTDKQFEAFTADGQRLGIHQRLKRPRTGDRTSGRTEIAPPSGLTAAQDAARAAGAAVMWRRSPIAIAAGAPTARLAQPASDDRVTPKFEEK